MMCHEAQMISKLFQEHNSYLISFYLGAVFELKLNVYCCGSEAEWDAHSTFKNHPNEEPCVTLQRCQLLFLDNFRLFLREKHVVLGTSKVYLLKRTLSALESMPMVQ